jgi:hypothetical protein
MAKRTYLTKTEAMSWGEFLHSDLRRLIKRQEAMKKRDQGVEDFMPVVTAMRFVTKQDMKLWRQLYDEGVREFNKIPEDPDQLQINFKKANLNERVSIWEESFKCKKCDTSGRSAFEYIETIVTGEVWNCSGCYSRSVFSHQPKKPTV